VRERDRKRERDAIKSQSLYCLERGGFIPLLCGGGGIGVGGGLLWLIFLKYALRNRSLKAHLEAGNIFAGFLGTWGQTLP